MQGTFLEHKGKYKGYEYWILRHKRGYFINHLCGYVKANKDIIDEIGVDNIDCHGGITYCDNHINYILLGNKKSVDTFNDRGVYWTLNNGEYFIGIDCAHADDYFETPKDVNFCIKECESIIDQLIKEL